MNFADIENSAGGQLAEDSWENKLESEMQKRQAYEELNRTLPFRNVEVPEVNFEGSFGEEDLSSFANERPYHQAPMPQTPGSYQSPVQAQPMRGEQAWMNQAPDARETRDQAYSLTSIGEKAGITSGGQGVMDEVERVISEGFRNLPADQVPAARRKLHEMLIRLEQKAGM